MVTDHLEIIYNALPQLMTGAWMTLQLSLLAIAIGGVLGFGLGMINSDRLRIPVLSGIIDTYIMVLRGTPLFVQLLIVYFALPDLLGLNLSPFIAGVATLAVNSSAYVAEIIRGGVNALPVGQWEASHALGYSQTQTLRYVILPQTVRHVMPSLTNELSSLIKETSILMVIGVPELIKVSKDIVARDLQPMTIYLTTAAIYFVMTTVLAYAAKKFEGVAHGNH